MLKNNKIFKMQVLLPWFPSLEAVGAQVGARITP